jgi:hypothetical protein
VKDNSEHLAISLPDQKNYDISYGLALKMAGEKLHSLEKMVEQCQKSISVCRIAGSNHEIQLKYLNRAYQVSWPEIEISLIARPEQVEIRDKILILDYLNTAKGTPLSGNLITFQELQAVSSYYPTFFKRAIKPLIDYFGDKPEQLIDAARELGGLRASYGDVSVTIFAFGRVPISFVIWKGDAEFPANAGILFDSTIQDYLSAEGIIVLCQLITWRLVNSIPKESGNF